MPIDINFIDVSPYLIYWTWGEVPVSRVDANIDVFNWIVTPRDINNVSTDANVGGGSSGSSSLPSVGWQSPRGLK